MQFQWLLCGRSTRWYQAACRFGPETLPRRSDRLAITIVAPAQLSHACRQAPGSVVLWPLDESLERAALPASLAALAQLAGLAVPTLHLIVPPNAPARFVPAGERQADEGVASLGLDLLELAGTAVLVDRPEDLRRFARLLRRFWERIRPCEEPLDALYLPVEPLD